MVGSVVLKPKVYGFSSTPPVVSASPALTVTVYTVEAASPWSGVRRYMLVLIHSPLPCTVGVMTSGWGSAACSPRATSGHDRPVERDGDRAVRAHLLAPSAGWVLVTSRKPAVTNLNVTSRCSFRPLALAAFAASVTRYSLFRSKRLGRAEGRARCR